MSEFVHYRWLAAASMGVVNEIVGVVTSGIYCLSGVCGGRPRPSNIRRFTSAPDAEAAGYRACHQCRPYRLEPMSTWVGTALICRAIQMILDGALHGGTEAEVGAAVGVSARHLRRRFVEEVGVTPTQLARSGRAHFARRLLDETDLSITEIAFASGFGSVRQFNRTVAEIFKASPRELRARRRVRDRLAADGGLALRLPFVPPLQFEDMLQALGKRAIPGVEAVTDGWYRRTISVDGDPGVLEVGRGGEDHLVARLHLPYWEGLIHHVRRARRIFGLDSDHRHEARSAADPQDAVCTSHGSAPYRPGAWDPFEVAVRDIVDRHGHPGSGEAIVARLVGRLGRPVPGLATFGLTHLFPEPRHIAGADLGAVGLTGDAACVLRRHAASAADRAPRIDRPGLAVPGDVAEPAVGSLSPGARTG